MYCSHCGHQNVDDANFCNKCGKGTQPTAAAPQSHEVLTGARPMRTTAATEVEVWSGSIPWKGLLNGWWLASFILVVPILIFMVVVWVKQRSLHYRITTERITITSGLLSRSSEDIQLVRIEDVQYTQGFLQRMFGVGTLHLISTDKTQADLYIYGVIDPPHFKEKIWSLVRERRQGMVLMEQLNT